MSTPRVCYNTRSIKRALSARHNPGTTRGTPRARGDSQTTRGALSADRHHRTGGALRASQNELRGANFAPAATTGWIRVGDAVDFQIPQPICPNSTTQKNQNPQPKKTKTHPTHLNHPPSRNHRTAKVATTTEIYRSGDALRASRNYGRGGALRARHNRRTIGRKWSEHVWTEPTAAATTSEPATFSGRGRNGKDRWN